MKSKRKVKGIIAAAVAAASAIAIAVGGIFIGKINNHSLSASAGVDPVGANCGSFFNLKADNSVNTGADNLTPSQRAFKSKAASSVNFGKNNSALMGWDVLTNDYEDDGAHQHGILLFAKSIVSEATPWNDHTSNDNAYWYTSKLRAYLNGYNSYYDFGQSSGKEMVTFPGGTKYFSDNHLTTTEYSALKPTTLTTIGGNSTSSYLIPTKGNFNMSAIPNAIKDFNDGSVVLGTNDAVHGITETTEDKVFLLDYNDIFDTDYGFKAHKEGANYDGEESGYRIGNLGPVEKNSLAYCTYNYWLRGGNKSPTYAFALCFYSDNYNYAGGCDINANVVEPAFMFTRPAVNLDPSKIIYTTTTEPTAGFASATANTGDGAKNTYKLYLKDSSYATIKPSLKMNSANEIKVTVGSKTSASNLVMLITDADDFANGKIKYQAVQPLSTGVAVGTDKKEVTFSAPAGITIDNIHKYTLSFMLTSGNGNMGTEAVYAAGVGYVVPEPEEFKITYDGANQKFAALSSTEQPQWYKDIIDMIDKVEYKDAQGNAINDTTDIIDSGDYTALITLKSSVGNFAGSADEAEEGDKARKIKFKVEQKTISLDGVLDVDDKGVPKTGGMPTFKTGDLLTHDTGDLEPKLRLVYQESGSSDWSKDPPTTADTHTVKVELYTKSLDDDKTNGICNYVLDKDYTDTYTRSSDKIKVPKFAAATQPYTGSKVSFILTDFDPDAVEISNLNTLVDGTDYEWDATLKQYTFYATDVAATAHSLSFALKTGTARVWDDSAGGNGGRTAEYNLTPITLNVAFSASTTPGTFSWQKDAKGNITISTPNVVEADKADLELKCEYFDKKTPSLKTAISNNELDISTLAIGEYTVEVSLAAVSSTNKNINYKLSSSPATQDFSITDKEITIEDSDLTWQYTNTKVSNGAAQALTGATLTYNGENFTVKLDESALADLGVEVKSYADEVKKDAKTYTTTVTLQCLEGYKFATGAKDSFTVNWTIAKADYDLSKVKWQYSDGSSTQEYIEGTTELIYIAPKNGYTLTLADLPSGLTASYSGNAEENANTDANPNYTATVDGWTYDTDNYNEPTQTFTCNWTISKREISIGWKEKQYSGSNGTFTYKIINNVAYENVVEYKYYKDSACKQPINIEDITVDPANKTTYYVVMSLRDSTKNNYTLTGTDKTSFVVGENKTAVGLSLVAASGVYNGKPQGKLKFDTISPDFKEEDLKVNYYLKTDTSFANPIDQPVNAGKYVILASLSESAQSGHIISGADRFDFEILKADFDMSKVHWQYAATGEATPLSYTEPLSYVDGGYTLTLAGLPDGLTVANYDGNTGDTVGTYQATVVNWTFDEDNFNDPAALTPKDWEIKKATIDVKFKDADNGTFKYKVFDNDSFANLVNVKYYKDSGCTEEVALDDIKVDPTGSKTYYVQVTLKTGADVNYELSGTNKLSFKVGENKTPVTVSIKGSGLTYDGETHFELAFDTMSTSLTKDDVIAEYYLKSDASFEHLLTEKPVNAGEYVVKIKLSDEAAAKHAIVGDTTFEYVINKATLDISGVKWGYIDEKGNEVEYDPAKPLNYTVKDGVPVAQQLVLIGLPEYLKDKITYGDPISGVGTYDAAYTLDEAAFDKVNYEMPDLSIIPELEEGWTIARREVEQPKLQKYALRYDGSEKTFVLNGFDENYMVITEGSLKQTEEGEYSVTVGLVDEVNTKWAGTTDATFTVKFMIIGQDDPEPLDPNDQTTNPTPGGPGTVDPENPSGGTNNDGDGGNGGGGITLPEGFPLWQVIVGGVSLVLSVAFIMKSCFNVSNSKRYRVPAGGVYAGVMVNGALFGVPELWWNVIALSLAGVCVISFIIMIITGHKLSNAKYLCEAEEKRRHDEEMKMIMMMMKNPQPAPAPTYANAQVDIKEIVTQVVAALLPTMQTTMQQLTAGGSSEYDDAELRRRMAESERRIEELEGRDDGFDDLIDVDLDEIDG